MVASTIVLNKGGGGDRVASDLDPVTGVDTLNVNVSGPLETSDRGELGIAVYLQNKTDGLLDLPFVQTASAISLAADTVVNSRNITLTAGHGLSTGANAGDVIELADDITGPFFMQAEIITVTGDIILLDTPVNRIYLAATALIGHSIHEMNVDGSVTPQIFSIAPFPVQAGEISRIICELRDTVAMDFETFGGLPVLTNGLILRINNGDGTYRNLFNFKSNGDIILQAFDHSFETNNGGGTRGFSARVSFAGQSKHGAAIRLAGSVGTGEQLELVVQDDLTGLTGHNWVAQGFETHD